MTHNLQVSGLRNRLRVLSAEANVLAQSQKRQVKRPERESTGSNIVGVRLPLPHHNTIPYHLGRRAGDGSAGMTVLLPTSVQCLPAILTSIGGGHREKRPYYAVISVGCDAARCRMPNDNQPRRRPGRNCAAGKRSPVTTTLDAKAIVEVAPRDRTVFGMIGRSLRVTPPVLAVRSLHTGPDRARCAVGRRHQ